MSELIKELKEFLNKDLTETCPTCNGNTLPAINGVRMIGPKSCDECMGHGKIKTESGRKAHQTMRELDKQLSKMRPTTH